VNLQNWFYDSDADPEALDLTEVLELKNNAEYYAGEQDYIKGDID